MKNQSKSSYNRLIHALRAAPTLRLLREFLASDKFMRDLSALQPMQRHDVMVLSAKLMADFTADIGPVVRVTATKAKKWDEVMIARLRRADALYGNDVDIGRALGITFKAAERARLRYIGPRAPVSRLIASPQKAA